MKLERARSSRPILFCLHLMRADSGSVDKRGIGALTEPNSFARTCDLPLLPGPYQIGYG
jgi:hypothetical protein